MDLPLLFWEYLERKIQELKGFTTRQDIDISGEVERLEEKLSQIKKDIYEKTAEYC